MGAAVSCAGFRVDSSLLKVMLGVHSQGGPAAAHCAAEAACHGAEGGAAGRAAGAAR